MKYKERVIKHNIDIPELRTVGYSDMTEIYYDPSVVSHHPRSFEYYFTHGIVVNEKRYIIKEFFVRESKLYAVITEDENKYYEIYLSFIEEDTLERIKKELEEFEKQLSKLSFPKPNQTLSLSNNILSISDGNSVELPQSSNQVLNLENHTLKISKGNTVELPNDHQTISKVDNKIVLSNNGGEVELPQSIAPYDDTSVKSRLSALENKPDKDTKYTAKGNGLILDVDNSFSIDMRLTKELSFPYSSSLSKTISVTPDKRYSSSVKNSFAYAIDNDGTPQNNAVVNGGIVFDYEGSYIYDSDSQQKFSGINIALTGVSTNNSFVSFGSYYQLEKSVEIFSNVYVDWKDSNSKVVVALNPKIVWSVNTGSHTENYTHYLTKEEIDSAEPIEIEVKEGETVVGRLTLTLKNVRFFIQSTQGKVVVKNPSNNSYYNLLRY